MHEQFCELFETLCAGFLKKEGYTVENFYEEIRRVRENAQAKNEEADEVVDVVYMVRGRLPSGSEQGSPLLMYPLVACSPAGGGLPHLGRGNEEAGRAQEEVGRTTIIEQVGKGWDLNRAVFE